MSRKEKAASEQRHFLADAARRAAQKTEALRQKEAEQEEAEQVEREEEGWVDCPHCGLAFAAVRAKREQAERR